MRGRTGSTLGIGRTHGSLWRRSPAIPEYLIRFTAGLLVAFAGVFLAMNSWAASYDVYLLAGQSNMDGMGLTNDLVGGFSVWTQPQTNVLIYYENHYLTNYVPSWQVLKPGWSGESPSGQTLSPTNFGPELTIGYVLFFVVHIAQVIRAGWNNFRSMVAGFEVVEAEEAGHE